MEFKYLLLFVGLVTGQDPFENLIWEDNDKIEQAETKCGATTDEGTSACVPWMTCSKANQRTGQTCDKNLDVCCLIESKINPTVKPSDTPVPTNTSTETPNGLSYCGERNPYVIDVDARSANDNEAQFGEFPWMVAVVDNNYVLGDVDRRLFLCGGSLIHPRIVLTAAHCVDNTWVTDISVRIGEWDVSNNQEPIAYQERLVVKITVHEQFDKQTMNNDVALLQLEKPVKKLNNVNTICLATQDQTINSQECFVSGWGKTQFGSDGIYPNILKKIKLPIVRRQQCETALRENLGSNFELHEGFMCAGGEEGKDACTGDGGGPLVCPISSQPKRYVQVGIVSSGIADCGRKGFPGVYADVSKFRTWIDSKMTLRNLPTNSYTF